MLWILVTLVALIAFFSLFRVVYPQPRRVVPTAQQVILLDPENPATRALLAAVQDRDYMIMPPEENRASAMLSERAPVFHPSFEGHEMTLRDLPQRNERPAPVRLMNVMEPELPPLDFSPLKPEPAPVEVKAAIAPLVISEGDLRARKIVEAPDLSGLRDGNLDGAKFHLGVNAAGRVIFALPVDHVGKLEEGEPALRVLRALRFAPADDAKAPPAWGTVTLRWSTGGTP